MVRDAEFAATQIEFFAGLVTEMKGASIPMGPDRLNFSIREPLGVVGRIVPFNHPFMFIAGKIGAPLAAGNTVVMKPPEQASMSSLRLAELIGDILPAGVFNLVPGGREAGAALAAHPLVAKVGLVGSVPTGRAVMRAASDTLKGLLLELGGKNALIAYDDADPDAVATGLVDGMNFTWCGQSCGSTSRAFVHEKIYDAVLERVKEQVQRYKPGIPTDPVTTMGSIINKVQYDKVLSYIQSAKDEGARLINGGNRSTEPELEKGLFVEPTIFADVTPDMKIFREEIFGLTASIWTQDLVTAHRTAMAVEAGYIWINDVSKHFVGAPFGGYKQSGIGREECMEELLSFTQEKNINVNLAVRKQD
jgi:betaine-aldehyde dehydrogenase